MKKYKITIEKFDRTELEGGAYIDENNEKILDFVMTEDEYSPISKKMLDTIFNYIQSLEQKDEDDSVCSECGYERWDK